MSILANDPYYNTSGFGNTIGDGSGFSNIGHWRRPMTSLRTDMVRPTEGVGPVTWNMNMDIVDTDKEYCVLVEVPGVPKDKVHVSIENNLLRFRAEKQQPVVEFPTNFVYDVSEIGYGVRRRHIHLPSYINQDTVQTCVKNGLLCIKFEKLESQAKKLEIKEAV